MRDSPFKYIGVKHDDDADDGTKRHRVPNHKAEDNSLVADLLGGRGGNGNRLSVHHFSHDSAATVGGAHQDRINAELLRSNSLQAAKQSIGRSVASGERNAQPAEESAKEWIQPSGSRESQAQHRVQAGV